MKSEKAYVLFDCGCHPMVSIVAPRREGEQHGITWPAWDHPEFDVTHLLVAKNGKWEIRK